MGLVLVDSCLFRILCCLDLVAFGDVIDFYRFIAVTYASFCGKKIDPEPGRCRRTDGKKWRCSKDAHPDSKYCERHMNRGRYRSRKLVESQTASQTLSTVASSEIRTGSHSHSGSFQNMPLHSAGNSGSLCFGSDVSQLKMEPIPYGIVKRGNRYIYYLIGFLVRSQWLVFYVAFLIFFFSIEFVVCA